MAFTEHLPFIPFRFLHPYLKKLTPTFFQTPAKGGFSICMKPNRQIYDRAFKRIFSLSDIAITNLINGLFCRDFPPDSSVSRPNGDFIRLDLKGRYSDVFVTVAGRHTFHLEAQTSTDSRIALRVFEYSFHYAMSAQALPDSLHFPESIVIYLGQAKNIPEGNILHFSFEGQGNFIYHVKNFSYLEHDTEGLALKKMAAFIPFQTLRLRTLLRAGRPGGCKADFDPDKFSRLQDTVRHDIIGTIETSLRMGYLTADDAKQLYEITNFLDEHIRHEFSTKMEGAKEFMKPLLPGALELPNDKYRLRIAELEQENAKFADEITKYADKNARYADENAQYADEILRLQKRIAELEAKQPNR